MSKAYRDMTPEEKKRFLELKKKSEQKCRTKFILDFTNRTDMDVVRWIQSQESARAAVCRAVRGYLADHPEESGPNYRRLSDDDNDDLWLQEIMGGRDR